MTTPNLDKSTTEKDSCISTPYLGDATVLIWSRMARSHYRVAVWKPAKIKLKSKRYLIGPVDRVFANVPGDRGSIPGRVIPKTLKWYLIPPCLTLSIRRYVSRVKWSNQGKGVAPSLTPRCSSYWIGNLRVALNYSCQLYFTTSVFFLHFFSNSFAAFTDKDTNELNGVEKKTNGVRYLNPNIHNLRK